MKTLLINKIIAGIKKDARCPMKCSFITKKNQSAK